MSMKIPPVLLTAFKGTSADQLIKGAGKYQTLLLPNDKVKDSERLISAIDPSKVSYIFAFGQKPNIKDKVYIEITAREGEKALHTCGDCGRLQARLKEHGISACLSSHAGTSYCNRLYWNGLNHIAVQGIAAEMIFLHVPFLKNISDLEMFQKCNFAALEDYITYRFHENVDR